MPRKAQSGLQTPNQRAQLNKRYEPYWSRLHRGLFLGYRTKSGAWVMRANLDIYPQLRGNIQGRYFEQHIGQDSVLTYEQARDQALALASCQNPSAPYTVKQAAEDYMAYMKAETKSAYQTETIIERHILPKFADRKLDSLTTQELNRWKNSLVTGPRYRRGKVVDTPTDPETIRQRQSSANRIVTVFKALLNKAVENRKVENSSAWKIVKPFERVDGARKVFLQPDECKRAINIAKGAFKNYVRTLWYTGARPGKEIELIQVKDFDPEGSIRIHDGKTGGRDVFLTDEGVKFFSRLTAGRSPDEVLLLKDDGKPWGKNHHARPMQQLVIDAKLPAETVAYSLRHTFISLALKGGANIKVVADQCGTSLKMLEQHYAKFLNADRRAMFNKAMPSFGFKPDNVRKLTA